MSSDFLSYLHRTEHFNWLWPAADQITGNDDTIHVILLYVCQHCLQCRQIAVNISQNRQTHPFTLYSLLSALCSLLCSSLSDTTCETPSAPIETP